VVFSFEPNFRAFTDGTQQILRNAMFGKDPKGRKGHERRPGAAARTSARRLRPSHAGVELVVRASGAAAARTVLARQGLRYRSASSSGRVAFAIANPGGKTGDHEPWTLAAADALKRAKVPVVMFRVP
jgi:hypothetical protein